MPNKKKQNQDPNEPGSHFAPEVRNVNRLTLAFAKAVASKAEDVNDNVLVSPYNAMTFLAMAATGAQGNTKKEYAKVLFGEPATQLTAQVEKLAALNASVLKSNDGKVTLKTANSMWVNSNHGKLKPGFEADLKRVFGAEINERDFSDQGVPGEINKWADDNTNHLINEIVKELTSDDQSILASALYYKGDWTLKFDRKLTKDKHFQVDGSTEDLVTPMMHQEFKEGDVTYQQGADYEAVALTYGKKNHETPPYQSPSMRIVLVRPSDASQSARDWLMSQDEKSTPAWVDPYAFQSALGTVELPHMDMEQDHNLIPALESMGFKNAFSGAANYGRIVDGDVKLTQVKQKIVFKTDEDGSEGAAITHGRFMATSVRTPPPRINVAFDRSFVFALQDIDSGAILFTGVVNKPNNEMKPAPKP